MKYFFSKLVPVYTLKRAKIQNMLILDWSISWRNFALTWRIFSQEKSMVTLFSSSFCKQFFFPPHLFPHTPRTRKGLPIFCIIYAPLLHNFSIMPHRTKGRMTALNFWGGRLCTLKTEPGGFFFASVVLSLISCSPRRASGYFLFLRRVRACVTCNAMLWEPDRNRRHLHCTVQSNPLDWNRNKSG